MIDNLFAHQNHFKEDSGNMPRSDSCLISSSSHNPYQNDSGSVLQGNWRMGMQCMDGATLILPDKSIIFPKSGFFKKLNPGRYRLSGVKCIDLWLGSNYGTC